MLMCRLSVVQQALASADLTVSGISERNMVVMPEERGLLAAEGRWEELSGEGLRQQWRREGLGLEVSTQ